MHLKNKPDLAEWFKDPENNLPELLMSMVDVEHAFKTIVQSPDVVYIFDKDLAHVHVVFNGTNCNGIGQTILYMNGVVGTDTKGEETITMQNTGNAVTILLTWGEKLEDTVGSKGE